MREKSQNDGAIMNFVRTCVFYFTLSVWTFFITVIFSPVFISTVIRRIVKRKIAVIWAFGVMILLRIICGVRYRVLCDNASVISEKRVLIASKHESPWETIFFFTLFKGLSFVVKEELLKIPFYGWYLKVLDMVPIKRNAGMEALRKIVKSAEGNLKESGSFLIFPEGTRVSHGVVAECKHGIYAVYKNITEKFGDVPLIPVALDSGKLWKKERFSIESGLITVRVHDKLPQNLSKEEFMKTLQSKINSI
ncbi:Putative 1-acyl-sn-glycerol-3-phosphate acyltransferase [Candidatus Fokinia solitaria]|uniref:1-acyl-sn-glycerol-3-phosphate acyltransferase n=1 Tax=Candidatus Fokinia solitaria TaxID=1802984 RepID=A0A2U8BRJ7_9RICK|nr:lysophospholipid acyltransferase family protein [Candidatus Fokinia solitaria]AWD32957.1 Putative 1-acyl-sn-glycerol-3-phosphate acyltransferase [Candidatus Fokinia solitaria]